MRHLACVVVLAALGGCATVKGRENVCPEYRDLRCLVETVCETDRARGCQVCRCADLKSPPPPGYAPAGPETPSTDAAPAWTPEGSVEKR